MRNARRLQTLSIASVDTYAPGTADRRSHLRSSESLEIVVGQGVHQSCACLQRARQYWSPRRLTAQTVADRSFLIGLDKGLDGSEQLLPSTVLHFLSTPAGGIASRANLCSFNSVFFTDLALVVASSRTSSSRAPTRVLFDPSLWDLTLIPGISFTLSADHHPLSSIPQNDNKTAPFEPPSLVPSALPDWYSPNSSESRALQREYSRLLTITNCVQTVQ
ncbi:hypothetical protein B0J14DRAFT_555082 [Halenospora varia]|nr:hypothetical protein B0J14DRAFT_555082 [Halenospora varia]